MNDVVTHWNLYMDCGILITIAYILNLLHDIIKEEYIKYLIVYFLENCLKIGTLLKFKF